MDKKKLVISGGTSFIAQHLLQKLDIDKYEIIAMVRRIPEYDFRICGVQYLEIDMDDYDKLDAYISTCDYYLAFAWNGTKREDRNNIKINEKSYHRVLDSIKIVLEKCGCKKVLIAGTHAEYQNLHTLMDENTDCNTELAYGKYKYQLYKDASELCKAYHAALINARMFSIYGTGDCEDKMIYKTLKKMKVNEEIPLTSAEHIWDFIHVDDVAEALRGLLESDIESGCYNIATMEHRTLKSYLEEMKMIIGSKSRLIYGAIPYESKQIPHVICDARKIMGAIDWKPEISFAEGIRKIMDNYK